jgi:hypothetical protein
VILVPRILLRHREPEIPLTGRELHRPDHPADQEDLLGSPNPGDLKDLPTGSITLRDRTGHGERAQFRRSVSSKAVIWLVAVAAQISMFCHGEAGCEIGLRRMR